MNNRMIVETLDPNGKFIMLKIMVETYGPSLALYMTALAEAEECECDKDEIFSYKKEDELDIFCMESDYIDLIIGQGQRYGIFTVPEGPDPSKRYLYVNGERFKGLMEEALDRRYERRRAKNRTRKASKKAQP